MATPKLLLSSYPTGSLTPSTPYNESMQVLDAVVQLTVEDKDLTADPVTTGADVGKCWIIGTGATSDWVGRDNDIAICTAANAWAFVDVFEGMRAWVKDDNTLLAFDGTTWTAISGGGGGGETATGVFGTTAWNALPYLMRGSWGLNMLTPGSTGGATALGVNTSHATGMGTGSSQAIAATDKFSRQVRYRYTSSAAAGSNAGVYYTTTYSCLDGGFFFGWRGGCSDAAAVANARWFVGMTAATTAPANGDPSARTNIIGFGADTGDTNLQFMHNDGSGTATKIDLGANFPANTLSADFYELRLWSIAGSGAVYYYARNISNGQVAEGSVSTDLPATSTLLTPAYYRNNGTTALAVRLDTGGFVIGYSLDG